MTCPDDPPGVACELDRIADALEQTGGISWLDIATGIVVPVLLGLLTLAVAIASVITARQAIRINRSIHEEKVQAERKASRLATGADLGEWFGSALFRKTGAPRKELAEAADRARGSIDRSQEPYAKELFAWLMSKVHVPPGKEDTESRIITYSHARSTIDEWVADPEAFARAREYDVRLEALQRRLDN